VERIRSPDISYPVSEAGIVTASAGCAEFLSKYSCADQVIQAADEQVYRAKQEGRNRAAVAFTLPQ